MKPATVGSSTLFDAQLTHDFAAPNPFGLEGVRDTLPHFKVMFAQDRTVEHIGVGLRLSRSVLCLPSQLIRSPASVAASTFASVDATLLDVTCLGVVCSAVPHLAVEKVSHKTTSRTKVDQGTSCF